MTTARVELAVDRAVELLDRRIGLRSEPTFRRRLGRCLRDAAAACGLDPVQYVDRISAAPDALQELLDRVTVQETAFFRHPAQFDALVRHVLAGRSTPITIWSAGCANGQEPHSLAMVLDELGRPGTVIATDISTKALDRTAAATYSSRELSGLSEERRRRHLEPAGSAWTVKPSVRDRVQTMRHNLVDPVPSAFGSIDVVFCRNVLIYFSAGHVAQFLDRLADWLAPGAFLFLGPAEALWQTTDRFEVVSTEEGYFYRRTNRRAAGPVRDCAPAATVAPPSVRPAPPLRPTARRTPRARLAPAVAEPTTSAPTLHEPAGLLARGQEALAAGAHGDAVTAFRQWAYLDPDDALAHLHLALALERTGDRPAALRAVDATRSALRRADPAPVLAALGGYQLDDLMTLLDTKRSELLR